MNDQRDVFRHELQTHNILFSCEGTAEAVIIQRLIEGGKLIVPSDNIVTDVNGRPYTRDRTAKSLQADYLGLNYPKGLVLVRLVDVNPGVLRWSRLYRDRVTVRDVVTRTEIEVLILVRENQYQDWYRHGKSSHLLPSQWCIQRLGFSAVKTRDFLESYWDDPDVLVDAIRRYTESLGSHKNEQLNLSDMLI